MQQALSDDFGETPYALLTPELVVQAAEQAGLLADGRVLALNSYENRVYQVGVEEATPVVIKFYRPGRWTRDSILEEHAFALELAAAEIPVVAPLVLDGETLLKIEDYPFAVYPRRGGRWPDLDTTEDRVLMGRFLGRLHRLGAAGRFEHRPRLDPAAVMASAADFVLEGDWLPDYQIDRYAEVTDALLDGIVNAFEAAGALRTLRIHGDCHRGNVLWTPQGPHFVDLDDCMTAPAIQDLWMLLNGTPQEMRRQATDLIEGYDQFSEFDRVELSLIEPLRALRMVHYAAWLARRWRDPAFPKAFPWFGEARYWEDHVRQLTEQLEALDAPTLRL